MRRVLGVVLGLLVVGLVGGYALAAVREGDPVVIATAAPVPARSPAAPTEAPVVCATDPDVAALAVDLPTTSQEVRSGGAAHGYGLTIGVPTGWNRDLTAPGQWKWAPPGAPLNTYVLRATIVAGRNQSPAIVADSRLAALRSAAADGNLEHLEVQSDVSDTFVATYSERGFCRLTMERVLDLGRSSAYVDLAVTGRLGDREGLMDLLARTASSLAAS